ncbi:MAG: glycoside hydrolase family 11 protein [Treponema sp.]|jgi:endo-1,4-beta-xylanase|nr:glycoside hydrolase family 11 protein [Treponema sp.]
MINTIKKQSRRLCVIAIILVIGFLVVSCPLEERDTGDSSGDFEGFTGRVISNPGSEQVTGKSGVYDWEFWNQNKQGNASMTIGVGGGGTFKCSWSGILNVLFRSGRKFGSTQTHQQIGTISIKYNAPVYNITSGDVSYLSVYGWTKSPLVEFYIVESHGNYKPGIAGTLKGNFTIDGAVYDIYQVTRSNAPSIEGNNSTFQQYFSVRRTKRTSGTISVSKHFEAWENLGMTMGKMYEVAFKVEGYQSSGSAEITENILSINGTPIK